VAAGERKQRAKPVAYLRFSFLDGGSIPPISTTTVQLTPSGINGRRVLVFTLQLVKLT